MKIKSDSPSCQFGSFEWDVAWFEPIDVVFVRALDNILPKFDVSPICGN